MTEGRVAAGAAAGAAAGSYLVQGRGTHDSAQDDLDAGHAGSVQEEEAAVYCVITVTLALRCDMRTAVCREARQGERLQAPSGWVATVCPDTPTTTTPRLSSALDMLCCAVLCCASHQRRSSNSRSASGSRGVPVHCMHRPRLIRGSTGSQRLMLAWSQQTILLTKIACPRTVYSTKEHAHAISYLLSPSPAIVDTLLGSLFKYRHHSTWQTALLDAFTTEVSESQTGGAETPQRPNRAKMKMSLGSKEIETVFIPGQARSGTEL